jgi:hypothetical protein
VISDADIQPLVADLFRVRIPTVMAHALNCYLWLGPDGVTVVDTGWADSAPVIARALELLGRRTSDVERIVLSPLPRRPRRLGRDRGAMVPIDAPSRGHGRRSPRPNGR